jgi:hypothetical protein
VRITNVDSQGSNDNIVIQVIGEISNKQAAHRKFVQTFVLATQTNGYFVLNDIFRHILDEENGEDGEDGQPETGNVAAGLHEPAPTAVETDTHDLAGTDEVVNSESEVAKLDKELDEVIRSEKTDAVPPTADKEESPLPVSDSQQAEDVPAPSSLTEQAQAEEATPIPSTEDNKEIEQPKEPEPSKTAPTPKASPAPPAVPNTQSKPVPPKTWANLVARVATPVLPSQASATGPSATVPKVASQPQQQAPPQTTAAAASAQTPREPSPANSGNEGWQTAGQEHGKRHTKTQGSAQTTDPVRAYIKNVFESIESDALKKELSKYGDIVYFDISRQKVSIQSVNPLQC